MIKAASPNVLSTNSEEIYCISYLRGLAALGVVFFHVRVDLWVGFIALKENPSLGGSFAKYASWLSLPTIFMGAGVMLFFVISGFCIHYPYAGPNGKKLDLQEYIVRRFCRIYPPYVVAVLFTFAVQWLGYHSGFLKSLDGHNDLLSVLMLQNSFGNQPECNPALWTIPIEVAFYIFFPLVYFGLRRSSWSTLAAGLVVSLLAIASSFLAPIQSSFLPYWFTWIAGAALAEQHKKKELPQPSPWLGFLGVLFLFFGLVEIWHSRANAALAQGGGYDGVTKLAGALAFGIAFSLFLWWSITNQRVYRLLPSYMHKSLMHLGDISYSLYLFHMPLFSLCGWMWVSHFGEKPVNYLITLPFVVLSIVVASIAYQYTEAPAHLAGRKLASVIKSRRTA